MIARRSVLAGLGAVATIGSTNLFTARSGPSVAAQPAALPLSPAAVVLAWNAAYLRHDVTGCLTYMSEDFQRIGDSTLWAPLNKQATGSLWAQFFAAFPDWTWKMNSMSVNGNLVICEFTETGTWTKPFAISPGVTLQPTNTSFTDHDADFFTVKNGRITEIRAYVTNNFERTYKLGTVCGTVPS